MLEDQEGTLTLFINIITTTIKNSPLSGSGYSKRGMTPHRGCFCNRCCDIAVAASSHEDQHNDNVIAAVTPAQVETWS